MIKYLKSYLYLSKTLKQKNKNKSKEIYQMILIKIQKLKKKQ